MEVGVPKEKPPPPAAALFAGVPKLKVPVGLVAVWVVWVPKVKPPPEGAGVEPASPKPVAGAAAVGFGVPNVKPEEGCPKLNPPLILFTEIKI